MSVALQFFRVLASCTSLFMLLSPIPMVRKMHQNRDTGVMSIVPLVAVFVNSHTWMIYGYIDENYMPVFATFVAGDVIALSYIIVYYRYSRDRSANHRVFLLAGLFVLASTLYVILGGLGYTGQTRHETAQIAGVLADATAMALYASPLVKILHVFRHKSAAFIPIHMVCAGSTNNVMWIVYSILAKKWIILVPGVGSLTIGVFQIVLYFLVYPPSTHPIPDELLQKPVERETHVQQDEPKLSVVLHSPRTAFHAVESPGPK